MLAAPQFAGPAIEIEFTTIVLHITEAAVADEMTVTALRLAGEQGARVVALYTLEVPADLPLLCAADEAEAQAARQLAEAEAFGVQYGVTVIGRLVRTRHAGRTLVDEARARSQRGDRARLAGTLAAPVAPVRRDRRLRAAERALQGDGRRVARVARAAAAEPCARGGARVSGRGIYRGGTFALNVILIVFGLIVLVRTATAGGSTLAVGYLIGAGLVAAGCLRLWILRRTAG